MSDCSQSGPGHAALTEALVQRHLAPMFSRVLADERIYLMTHSLGRPLDRMAEDVCEAVDLWYARLGSNWDDWLAARDHYRSLIACLLDAPRLDTILPVPSAGEGLRVVLNALTARQKTPLEVLSTTGEFHSTQVVLEQYAAAERITLRRIAPDAGGYFSTQFLLDAVTPGTGLVAVSQVMFQTGQLLQGLDHLADACHARGARLLVDAYHSVGALPVDVWQLHADFLTGGCYKYLRGGPGAAFLYISPDALESGLAPLDAGWFALRHDRAPDDFTRNALLPGGNVFLQDTPDVLPWFQARSGLEFTLDIGVGRLREYALEQLHFLRSALEDAGVAHVRGGDQEHGAFVVVHHAKATLLAEALREQKIVTNARGDCLRLCPDCLTRQDELEQTAEALGSLCRQVH